MPEGDTVFKIAAYLRARLVGAPVTRGRIQSRPDLSLAGRRVAGITTHGKHLFLEFEDGGALRTHLGMHGSWHRYPEGAAWRKPAAFASVELQVNGTTYVCFNAEEVEWLRRGGLRERDLRARLGPDLLADEVDLPSIVARARNLLEPDTIAADLLLDQRVAAGIGNVYKSEVLFLERIHPGRRLSELDDAIVTALYRTARICLQKNTGAGPRVTRPADALTPPVDSHTIARRPDSGDRPWKPGPGPRLWVYGRGGRPCLLCGTVILSRRMGRTWRGTCWCPRCQAPDRPPIDARTASRRIGPSSMVPILPGCGRLRR